MRIAIRADASLVIGSGHIMRCLTLANLMRDGGHEVVFISRAHPGNMLDFLGSQGHHVAALPAPPSIDGQSDADWLGVSQHRDALETIAALSGVFDLLVVDHYGLSAEWEAALRPCGQVILAIDDLADRSHDCDILLDQNLVADLERRYRGLLPDHAIELLGPQYALVRPEFAALRAGSLARRQASDAKRLVIFMGGSDPQDDTSLALEGALQSGREWDHIDVVVGMNYGGRARHMIEGPVELHVQTPFMAQLMAAADLAITAGGSISWEKCVLGLPSLVVVQAENQAPIATALGGAGTQLNLGGSNTLSSADYAAALRSLSADVLFAMSNRASAICDGLGAKRTLAAISRIFQS